MTRPLRPNRAIVATWRSRDDLSGVAADGKRGVVFMACGDHVIVLDTAHDGRIAASMAAGAGINNIDYSEEKWTAVSGGVRCRSVNDWAGGPQRKTYGTGRDTDREGRA